MVWSCTGPSGIPGDYYDIDKMIKLEDSFIGRGGEFETLGWKGKWKPTKKNGKTAVKLYNAREFNSSYSEPNPSGIYEFGCQKYAWTYYLKKGNVYVVDNSSSCLYDQDP